MKHKASVPTASRLGRLLIGPRLGLYVDFPDPLPGSAGYGPALANGK